jgi:hypothetical protein
MAGEDSSEHQREDLGKIQGRFREDSGKIQET